MRTRPTRTRLTAAVLAALCLLGAARCGGLFADRPNVLVIVMDTTRADRCGFLGWNRPTTPELDRIAERSIVFEDAWSPSPWTLPAHSSLFTGVMPHAAGFDDGDNLEIARERTTLAELLRGAGWRTGCFTCNGWIGPHTGATRGFEKIASFVALVVGGQADLAHGAAFDWMTAQRDAGERFFAFINDVEPHTPWNPMPSYRAKFLRPDLPEDVVERVSRNTLAAPTRDGERPDPADVTVRAAASDLYDAEIAGLDEQIGRLLRRMEERGMLDDTMVVIAGDHGEGLGDHGWLEHGIFLHRELLHVPLLIRMPGGRDARRVADPVRLHDVMPTILEACGVPVPDGLEAESLLGATAGRIVRSEERPIRGVMPLAAEALGPRRAHEMQVARRSVYDGRWHLVVDSSGGELLYDVEADPGELRNLASRERDVVTRLRAHLSPDNGPAKPGGGKR